MTQGTQPMIHGAEWIPNEALTFTQPLLIDAARAEVMRFFTERHEGHAVSYTHLTLPTKA